MSKENDINWDFDPSNEDEFVKNIERALREEGEQEKINIEYDGGIQIIDLKEMPSDNEIANTTDSSVILETDENTTTNATDKDDQTTQDALEIQETQEPQDESEDEEFAAIVEAVHKVASKNLEELDSLTIPGFMKVSDEVDDSMVDDITRSLAKLAQEEVKEGEEKEENQEESLKKKKLLYRIAIPTACVLFSFLLLFLFFRYTKPGQNLAIKVGSWFAATRTNYNDGSEQEMELVQDEIEDESDLVDLPELNEDDIDLKAEEGAARHEDYAVNILLLGEEAIDSGTSRGRTDVMVILTLNSKEKSIKLTSLMRDLFVQIPGHLDNKLNSAYATGGINLLFDTIELNFDLKLDGYALVGFNDFEKIIDLLGGVDITLTKNEANWLNTTNYISNPAYRTVVAGSNHMNGNQALGYCRIRSVGTASNEYNDFGRTSRHRILIDAIFNEYKTLGLWDLVMVANSCLPMITTDLDAGEIEQYLKLAMEIGLNELEQCRIPADGLYEDATIRKMRVIVPDLQKNVEVLHDFVFGTEE